MFVGSEGFLLQNMQHGGAGCISATANVNPAAIDRLYQEWQQDNAASQQAALDDLRSLLMQFPMIPALKAVVAKYSGETAWQRVRPPLVALSDDQAADICRQLDAVGFQMPELTGN
jgi:4-hydroxy-tetrahydrodipicolinate synthase